jgi:hypothetical protein
MGAPSPVVKVALIGCDNIMNLLKWMDLIGEGGIHGRFTNSE